MWPYSSTCCEEQSPTPLLQLVKVDMEAIGAGEGAGLGGTAWSWGVCRGNGGGAIKHWLWKEESRLLASRSEPTREVDIKSVATHDEDEDDDDEDDELLEDELLEDELLLLLLLLLQGDVLL